MSMIGETIAHYRVTDKIGAGGMGEVYKATDSRLNRSVAIKILPPEFAHDSDRMARLHREAQVLASLSHPNIAAVYGLEESGGRRALVMELAEGEDLSQRLRNGPIPLEPALRIALGVAEALEAAHERGVIHRDLKPANIKVAGDGHVKVLDFGLAKALDPDGSSGEGDPGKSPTLSLAATRAGLILGTAAYMSPEQASGAPVDKRSDVWAFGVVLFEMLTGQRLFQGESVSHTLADVLRSDVDWNRLPKDTPRAVRRLLERCLERDRRKRLRDIGEARIAIEEELGSASSAATRILPARPAPPSGPRRWLPWSVAAAAVLLAAAAVVMARRPATSAAVPIHVDAKIADEALWTELGSAVELSPDGSRIAYVTGNDAQRQLYVRPLNQLSGTRLVEGRASGDAPYHQFFSPDGAWVGYATAQELRKVPVAGGTPLTLCKVSRSRGAAWGPDDMIVLAPGPDTGLVRLPAAGGEPVPLTTLNKEQKEATHRWPQILPGGKVVLFTSNSVPVGNYDNATIQVVTIATGERKVVQAGGSFGRYVPSGHLVYVNRGTLFAVPFDMGALEVKGTPAPVLQNVTSAGSEGGAQITFSSNGLLAYIRGGPLLPQYPATWVDRSGRVERLLDEPGTYANPRLSPDGTRLALTVLRDGNWDIWVYDLAREVATRLTFTDSIESEQIWSPDGRELMFSSDRAGVDSLFRKSADGSGEEHQFAKHDTPMWAGSWSSGANAVAFTTLKSNMDVGVVSLDGSGKVESILSTTFAEHDPTFSPDGRWLAYTSSESGQSEIYVRPFPSGGGRWQISVSGGAYPRWSRDGRELFYRTDEGLMVAAVDAAGGSLRTDRPRLLFKGGFRGGLGGLSIAGQTFADYDVSPDGKRFVMFPAAAATGEQRAGIVTLVSPWFDELARTFGGKR